MQLRVADEVARLSGEAPSAVGIDGCGAPLFAISLIALARGFGAVNAALRDTSERQVADAMRAHPEMVGGTGREDTRLMQAIPGLLVKGGAEGVHCAALPDGRCVAVKITDGGDRARMPVLVGALRSLGVGDGDAEATALLDELGTGIVLGGGRTGRHRRGRARRVLTVPTVRSPCGTRCSRPPPVGSRARTRPPGWCGKRTGEPVLLIPRNTPDSGAAVIGRPASYCKGVRHGARPAEG